MCQPNQSLKGLTFAVVALLALGCRARIVEGARAQIPPRAVAVILAILNRDSTSAARYHTVVDTSTLRSMAHMDRAAIAQLARLMGPGFTLGSATQNSTCNPDLPACMGFRLGSYRVESDTVVIARGHWVHLKGCGDYGATFTVRFADGRARIVDVRDGIIGDCGPPYQ